MINVFALTLWAVFFLVSADDKRIIIFTKRMCLYTKIFRETHSHYVLRCFLQVFRFFTTCFCFDRKFLPKLWKIKNLDKEKTESFHALSPLFFATKFSTSLSWNGFHTMWTTTNQFKRSWSSFSNKKLETIWIF